MVSAENINIPWDGSAYPNLMMTHSLLQNEYNCCIFWVGRPWLIQININYKALADNIYMSDAG